MTTPRPEVPAGAHRAYLIIAGLAFVAMTVVFLFFPRTRYSELEKRDMIDFPNLADTTMRAAEKTAAISQWFSDTEPFRDHFMTLSMNIRNMLRFSLGNKEDMVLFRPSAPDDGDDAVAENQESTADTTAHPEADENAKLANAGIIIVGSGENVRALMAFGGSPTSGKPYIGLVDHFAELFPGVRVYALVAPQAAEFYLPEKASKASRSQKTTIDYIRDNLSPDVTFVDAYSALAAHTAEDIYLRTDHHWAPLGGFYAARELARAAGVPFKELDSYARHVVKGYVGSMYGYSKDISVKNAPEDFVYYTPTGVDYKTTYITYGLNKDYQVISESKPYAGQFFHHFKDGSGGAYCTFMGGDQHLVKVETGTPGNRRLMIIKDSFGNTLPGYLFHSFSEIHVVDFRYFPHNLERYVRDTGITDIVIAFNVYNVCSSGVAGKVRRLLRQSGSTFAKPDSVVVPSDTVPSPVPVDTTSVKQPIDLPEA
ncbi:MAG: hypothetical protein K2O00_06715 [Muribaculaceae bacterium]|nr:hypothetical protein [Muribaculaceae bacterium]